MPDPTGILLGRTHQAVVHRSGCLWRITAGAPPSRIAQEHPEVQFLTASPDGQHFAYWLQKDECFHLASAAGQELWKRRINTDRAMAHDIRFSPSSDALACIDDYDGGHRLHLFDLGTKSVSECGPSHHPIGFDASLQRFAWTRFSPEGPQLPVVDRNGSVRDRIYWRLDGWSSLAIQTSLHEIVVFRERSLFWLPIHASEPSTAVADCVPSEGWESWTGCTLQVSGGLALISVPDWRLAVLAHRNLGVLWKATQVLSATLHGHRTLAHFSSGALEVLGGDGSKHLSYAPPPGTHTVAASLTEGDLCVLECSEAGGEFCFRDLPILNRQ